MPKTISTALLRKIITEAESISKSTNVYLTTEAYTKGIKDLNVAMAQQSVVNLWHENDLKIDSGFKAEAIRRVNNIIAVTEDNPVIIEIFHNRATTASEYSVTSTEQLVDYMIDNFQGHKE